MPQTVFLGRRWRLATDALPLVFYPILSGLSIAVFILLLFLLGVIIDSRYSCDQYTKVGIALFAMTTTYAVDVMLLMLLTYLGWRGAPLNESKRMPQMSVLVHLWVTCALVKAGFTGFGLYVLYSPKISASCWSDNPCSYYGQTTLAKACVPGASGEVELTPACQVVFPRADEYLQCVVDWSEYAAGWMIENYRGTNETTGDAFFDFPGVVDCARESDFNSVEKYLNRQDIERYENVIGQWPAKYRPDQLFGYLYGFYLLEREFLANPAKVEGWIKDGMTDAEEGEVLLGDNFVLDYMVATVRYASGNSSATVEDTPWNTCMSEGCATLLPDNCTQWRIMAELPNVYRWRGLFEAIIYISVGVVVVTVLIFVISFNAFPDYESKESWEGLLGRVARRLDSYADYDETWMAGIGGLLWGLFGGVDLDVTDILLGLYLVWLRQKWKRKELVLRRLKDQGHPVRVKSENVWWSAFGGLILYPIGLDWRLFSGRRWRGWLRRRHDESGVGGGDGGRSGAEVGQDAEQYLTLQHSMARIPSFVGRSDSQEVCIEERKQHRAFLTPLELRNLDFVNPPPDRPVEELYLGKNRPNDKVEVATLEMLRYYLPFARASYGLHRGAWKACTKYRWYDWGYRLKKPAYFKKKNFEMLLEMMDVGEDSVLHASYDLGTHLKPYMIIKDENDGMIVSIRGTVGAVDLITDLLSQPVSDGDGVFYHVGMLSSARAIVSDMKEKGVWKCLLARCDHGKNKEREEIKEKKYDQKHVNSKVVLTGHSLGAGLAYLVGIELLKSGADPSRVMCVAFNPPGGLSSEASSKLEMHYSVIVNKDAISRMSITTMKRLIDDMMLSLARCRRPKLSILFDGVLLGRYAESDWDGVFKSFEALHAEERAVLYAYLKKGKLAGRGDNNEYVLPMYPPGKLVFLRMLRENTWDAVWIKADQLMDEGLVVGWGMARDHLLATTKKALDFVSCGVIPAPGASRKRTTTRSDDLAVPPPNH